MKALVYYGPHNIALEERPLPTLLKPTDVILKVLKTTICGTDSGIYKGKNPEISSGRILGHEGVGIVEEVGAAVSKFNVGDKVLVSCITSCGSCGYCKKQIYAHCEDGGWILGYQVDGMQAEYVRIPYADNSLYAIPEGLDDEIAVLLSDILPTGHEIGVQYGQVKPGDTVAIVGAGPVGLSALITAQFYSPATIIMIDTDEHRLSLALELGATHTVLAQGEQTLAAVQQIVGPQGVDVAIEAVGLPLTWNICQQLVKAGGHLANVGVHGEKVDFDIQNLWIKNLTITTGLVNTNTTSMLLKTVSSNTTDLKKLITHHYNLTDIEEAYQVFMHGAEEKALKIIIQPN